MKKRTAILLSLALAASTLFTGTAFGEAAEAADAAEEEVLELSWDMVEEGVKEAGLEGDFVTFDEVAVKMWIPSVMEAQELTDEDKENGYIAYYTTEDEAAAIAVVYVDVEGMTLEEYGELLAEDEECEEIEMGFVNGLPCISYTMPESDSVSIAFATEEGYILEVTMAPKSDEGFESVCAIVTCSIQEEEQEETK